MVSRIHLTKDERAIIERVSQGWRQKLDQWTIARLALARSLQMIEAPSIELYPTLPAQRGGVELHPQQLIGEGRANEFEDFTDLYCAMLSIYEGVDLFEDEDRYHAALQRHVRRGLAVLNEEWHDQSDLNRYILDEVLVDRVKEADSGETSDDLGERVTRALGQIGVDAKLQSTSAGPRLTRFSYELPLLDDLDRLRRGQDKIGFALGLGDRKIDIAVGTSERTVVLDVPRPSTTWKTVNWTDIVSALNSPAASKMSLPICLGTSVLGEPLLIDLAEAPHLFIGGTTGSGKSMCLHSILLSLNHNKASAPELLLIDPKAVEFAGYRGLPNLIGNEPVVTPDDAYRALNELVEEMERRQTVFKELGARDISEALDKGARLKRIVAVVDELGDLFLNRREIEIPLIKLAQKSRSSGIHLVLATQRPEAATFPGLLRSNIPSRIALTVQKNAESRIILDEGGAEQLLGKGDMLVKFTGQQVVRGHGSRVLPSDISETLR
ncbi:DndE family protein [Rhizobium lemnae]|uniref:FtsK/SpoIIIE domain-containing protein n=1 Tax=Rhizobium lemnae TaxID=1214924 RepID=A0ABV8ECR1_9HYPH|nr:FtsK/SpoIIIE domain-containing protein [Rhizobium lemnae]MCJ8508642.1 DndE family protein [Rhizobium lemnae]